MTKIMGFQLASGGEFGINPPRQVDWIWEGYLARGATTLLTSQWKAGKTTLVSVLLKHLALGGKVGGLRVKPTKAVIVSEEPLERWHRRSKLLHFNNNLTFLCRTPEVRATPQAWQGLVSYLWRLGHDKGVELVIIDPLAPFMPGATENLSAAMRGVLEPLEQLTSARMSVLLLHHPRKGKTRPGQAARGSGALAAFVDVLIEMKLASLGTPASRRRRLRAWSRFDGTPVSRIIELSADGASYAHVPDNAATHDESRLMAVVEQLLNSPPRMLTRYQMLERWPERQTTPEATALWRQLEAAVRAGRLYQEGAGHRNDPFRYGLPLVNANTAPTIDATVNSIDSSQSTP